MILKVFFIPYFLYINLDIITGPAKTLLPNLTIEKIRFYFIRVLKNENTISEGGIFFLNTFLTFNKVRLDSNSYLKIKLHFRSNFGCTMKYNVCFMYCYAVTRSLIEHS